MSIVDRALLGKYALTILKDRSLTDIAKVAAAGVTVDAYVFGATVRTTKTINNGVTASIDIYDPGDLRVGDTVQVNGSTLVSCTVQAIQARDAALMWSVSLTNASGSAFVTTLYDRLIVTSRRPTLWRESKGIASLGGSSVVADSNGFVEFYARGPKLDLVVSGTGMVTPQVIANMTAGDVGPTVDVRDFGGSIKNALAYTKTLPSFIGPVVIRVPAGVYTYQAADMQIAVNIPCRILGDGSGLTYIQIEGAAGDENKNLFDLTADNALIEGMTLYGTGVVGTGQCINAEGSGVGNTDWYTFTDLVIHNWSNAGMHFGKQASLTGLNLVRVERCYVNDSQSGAQVIVDSGCTMVEFSQCRIGSATTPTGVYGWLLHPCANVRLVNCDGIPADTSTELVYGLPNNAFAAPHDGGANLVIEGCDFEWNAASGAATTPMVYAKGWSSVHIKDTIFYQFGSGVHLEKCYAPVIDSCIFKDFGGSGFEIKFTDCYMPQETHCMYEGADGGATNGARRPAAVTIAGFSPGYSRQNLGLTIPTFLNDAERDTAAAAGADSKAAILTAGTMIYVVTPTAPTSHLQIRHGGAWVGIAQWTGAAAAAI